MNVRLLCLIWMISASLSCAVVSCHLQRDVNFVGYRLDHFKLIAAERKLHWEEEKMPDNATPESCLDAWKKVREKPKVICQQRSLPAYILLP